MKSMSMFMGVVGIPLPHRQFNGKIFLNRVSIRNYIQKYTAYTNFTDNALINDEIILGKWRELIVDLQITISEIKNMFIQITTWTKLLLIDLSFRFQLKLETKETQKV